ncbi:hypothetical protein BJ742DRAFT_800383 [Cladochytrium replicatum]|nr:hypothetical protein BJ742DRAFT_800383 [Cladochytrium replicatum]
MSKKLKLPQWNSPVQGDAAATNRGQHGSKLSAFGRDLDSWQAHRTIVTLVLIDFVLNQAALSLALYDPAASSSIFAPVNLDTPKGVNASTDFIWSIIRKVLFGLIVLFRAGFFLEICFKIFALGFVTAFKDGWFVFDAIVVFVALLAKLALPARESLVVCPVVILFRLWRINRIHYLILEQQRLQHLGEIESLNSEWEAKLLKEKERAKSYRSRLEVANGKLRVLMGEDHILSTDLPDDLTVSQPSTPRLASGRVGK